jgi:hypothetical protein
LGSDNKHDIEQKGADHDYPGSMSAGANWARNGQKELLTKSVKWKPINLGLFERRSHEPVASYHMCGNRNYEDSTMGDGREMFSSHPWHAQPDAKWGVNGPVVRALGGGIVNRDHAKSREIAPFAR